MQGQTTTPSSRVYLPAPAPASGLSPPGTVQVLRFRRLELNTSSEAFWGELIRSAGASLPGSNDQKAVLKVPRADVPAEVYARGILQELEAAGVEAAKRSVSAFFEVVNAIHRSMQAGEAVQVMMVEMKFVGLTCEGRGGLYDLIHFPHRNVTYAADSFDDSIVYVAA